ncbi:MAG: hypothetical protein JWO98_4022 [Frankiales bacterium]|nr:hypothetical protein [Frankiales bacterium]
MDWAFEQAAAAGASPVLRVHSHTHDWTHPTSTYARYALVATVVTDPGRRAKGPTLVPDAHSVGLVAGGMPCADGFALAVEEHPALPLAGWAAEQSAVNRRTQRGPSKP